MDRNDVLNTLKRLISEGSDGEIRPEDIVEGPNSLRNLGLSSLVALQIMVTVEDEFGIEWEDEVEDNVLSDLDAMCDYILGLLTDDVAFA